MNSPPCMHAHVTDFSEPYNSQIKYLFATNSTPTSKQQAASSHKRTLVWRSKGLSAGCLIAYNHPSHRMMEILETMLSMPPPPNETAQVWYLFGTCHQGKKLTLPSSTTTGEICVAITAEWVRAGFLTRLFPESAKPVFFFQINTPGTSTLQRILRQSLPPLSKLKN